MVRSPKKKKKGKQSKGKKSKAGGKQSKRDAEGSRAIIAPVLRLRDTGQWPELSKATGHEWALFLSHQWANQDVVALLKRQLQQLLPGVRVFLE